MNPEGIRNLLREQPFVPFRIHLSDQRTFDVPHPDIVHVTSRLLYVGILDPEQPTGLALRAEMISPIHVVSVEPLVQHA